MKLLLIIGLISCSSIFAENNRITKLLNKISPISTVNQIPYFKTTELVEISTPDLNEQCLIKIKVSTLTYNSDEEKNQYSEVTEYFFDLRNLAHPEQVYQQASGLYEFQLNFNNSTVARYQVKEQRELLGTYYKNSYSSDFKFTDRIILNLNNAVTQGNVTEFAKYIKQKETCQFNLKGSLYLPFENKKGDNENTDILYETNLKYRGTIAEIVYRPAVNLIDKHSLSFELRATSGIKNRKVRVSFFFKEDLDKFQNDIKNSPNPVFKVDKCVKYGNNYICKKIKIIN